MLGRVVFHLSQHFFALRQHGIEVVVDRPRGGEVVVPPTGGGVFLLSLSNAGLRNLGLSHALPFRLRWCTGFQPPMVMPGFISCTSTPGTSFCKALGVPVRAGKVPKCMGITVFGFSRLMA